jgi:hypothetical protein
MRNDFDVLLMERDFDVAAKSFSFLVGADYSWRLSGYPFYGKHRQRMRLKGIVA